MAPALAAGKLQSQLANFPSYFVAVKESLTKQLFSPITICSYIMSLDRLLPYSHSVLFTELFDPQLVHGGGHVLDRLLQVLGITLHQWLRDSAATVLEEGSGHKSLNNYGTTNFIYTTLKRH